MNINLVNPSNATSVKSEVVVPLKATTPEASEVEARALVKAIEEGSEASKANKEDNPEKLQEAVAELSDTMSMMKKGLAFRVDDSSGVSVVNVMDMDSGETIRQIPTEEALELAQKLFEVSGMLMKTEA
ncbi:flagellar protein FlaG [Shewanella psychrophila]|uniref:Flagellar protein FlaG n=1 Tax=Shewanella psychrophila TaxID=225848 RepID=A0A1S6HU11_9GAMM|nr:flagellar protein FlaG [Shewanella psychrophila]AQS38908.1 flagellar protein FlaG [Shewanella psychrophila]